MEAVGAMPTDSGPKHSAKVYAKLQEAPPAAAAEVAQASNVGAPVSTALSLTLTAAEHVRAIRRQSPVQPSNVPIAAPTATNRTPRDA